MHITSIMTIESIVVCGILPRLTVEYTIRNSAILKVKIISFKACLWHSANNPPPLWRTFYPLVYICTQYTSSCRDRATTIADNFVHSLFLWMSNYSYIPLHGPDRTRTDPTEFRRKKVRAGPCRVRVVEFSYYWSLKFSDGKWTASRPGRATRLPCVCFCCLHRDINSAANRPLLCSLPSWNLRVLTANYYWRFFCLV